MSRKLISFDWAIKKLLRSKANFVVLEGFLSELLFTDIKIVEVLESESNKDDAADKSNQVDIKVKDENEQIILIEVQYSREQDYLFRMLFGAAKTITEHMEIGDKYANVSKVISINILYFDFCQGGDYIYHGTTEFIGIHNKSKLSLSDTQQKLFSRQKVADIFPEYYIINIKNFDGIAKDTLDEWIYFLKEEEIKEEFKAKGLREAKEKLDRMKLTKEENIRYERYVESLRRQQSLYDSSYLVGKEEGIEQGLEQGLEQGIELGIQQEREAQELQQRKEKIAQAKMMLESGLPIEQVAKFTGLTVDDIRNEFD